MFTEEKLVGGEGSFPAEILIQGHQALSRIDVSVKQLEKESYRIQSPRPGEITAKDTKQLQ